MTFLEKSIIFIPELCLAATEIQIMHLNFAFCSLLHYLFTINMHPLRAHLHLFANIWNGMLRYWTIV